ncbi:hypothetical protein [Afifella aestuarii]|uniref:hypothetical protein n=1 Tax=Afifella aestuarii TaxID=1909496 RepID=UPI000FE35A23|nr:hypothetical protein [Afifella aestuarii]
MTRDLLATRRRAPQARGGLAELTRARALAASLVLRHGEELLPIFDRLDRECAALEKREDALDRVRAIAATRAQAAAG